jgi:hypothetical protein
MNFSTCVSIVFWWTIYAFIKLAKTLTIAIYIYSLVNKPFVILVLMNVRQIVIDNDYHCKAMGTMVTIEYLHIV